MAARRVLEVDAVVDSAKLAAGFRRMGSAAEKFGKDASRAGATGSKGLDRLGKSAQATSRHLKGMSPGLAGAIGGFTSLAGAAALLKDSVKQTESLAKGTVLLARTTGESTQEASRWVAVARSRGVEATALNRSFVALSKNIKAATDGGDKQIETFKRLGVSQQELKRGDVSQIIGDISDAFARMPDGAQKAATAQQLFGRQAQTLVPMLNKGSQALREQLALSDKYGTTLSKGQVAQSLKAVQAQRELNLAMTGLKVQLGQAVIPALTVGVTKVTAFVAQMRSGQGAGGKFAEKMREVWQNVKPTVVAIGQLAGNVAKFVANHPNAQKMLAVLVPMGAALKVIGGTSTVGGIARLASSLGSVGGKAGAAALGARALGGVQLAAWTAGVLKTISNLNRAGLDPFNKKTQTAGRMADFFQRQFDTIAPAFDRVIPGFKTVHKLIDDVAGAIKGKLGDVRIYGETWGDVANQITLTGQALGDIRQPLTMTPWSPATPVAPSSPHSRGRRRGGFVFQGGGTVPALVSSGEVIVEPGGSAWRAPGAPVAADNVPAMLKPGSAVLTWDGQARMMAGQSLASAVANQAPHFKDGGYAFHREPVGYGNHTHAGRGLAVPRSSTHGRSLGRFLTTAYGPPWDAIEGGGITSTGVKLTQGIQKFVVAVDPSVIAQHTPLNVWPNPFNDPGRVFWSEDTGGAIRGKHIDIFHAAADGTKDRWNRQATVWLAGTERGPGANTAGTPSRTVTRWGYRAPYGGTGRVSRAAWEAGWQSGLSDPFGYEHLQDRTDFYNEAKGRLFGTWTKTTRTIPGQRPARPAAPGGTGGGVVSDARKILASGNTRFPLRLETGGTARRDFESIVSHGDGQAWVPHTGQWTPVKRSLMDALTAMAGSGGTWINALTGGNHSNGSHHYSGTAVDLDLGSPLGAGRIQSIARRFGGARNYETSHIHLDFRRGGRVQRFRTGTRSVSKAGGSWSGAPTHYLKDAQDGLGSLLKIGISKGEEPKVKGAVARELRLIDRLSLPQLTEFGRVARNFWTGIQGPPKTRQTKRAWLQQVIEYAGSRTSMLLTAPIGVTQSVEDSIEKAAGRLPDQLTLRGIDPDSREGLGAQIDLNATSITRLEARRRKLQADLRAARRLRRPKGEIKQITDAITEVDDRLLGLRASNTRLARQQSTAQSNAEIQAGTTAGGQDPDLQAQLDQANERARVATRGQGLSDAFIRSAFDVGDIGSGGPTAWQAAGGRFAPGVHVTINTLHPGDSQTLAAIADAATQGLGQQGFVTSPRAVSGL